MIEWSEVETVILDMDGTLLDLAFDNYFWQQHLPEHYGRERGLSFEEARERVQRHSADQWGSLNWYCLDHWSQALKIDIEALKRSVSHKVRIRPHTLDFLNFLNEQNKDVLLVTNAHPDTLSIKLEASGLHVERMVSSHEYRLAKENPGFWHQLRDRENIDLGRSLLIDDSPPVLQRARREGVGRVLQMLQPDSTREPVAAGEFPGIIHFIEIMTVTDDGETQGK